MSTTVTPALHLIVEDAIVQRLVVETYMRSVSATGHLMAVNAERYSSPRVSDQGTLYSLRSWQHLIEIPPPTEEHHLSCVPGTQKDRFNDQSDDEWGVVEQGTAGSQTQYGYKGVS